jgi:phosphate:Na+ symporter
LSILNFVELFGGLAFFLYGMTLMSGSLEKMTGGQLEKMLKKATDNPWKGLLVGTIITIAIQSSSATTVMLVGFVNSGIMELHQTISVIMGSDIGTTLTAWILSLTGIDDSASPVLSMLKPENFSLVFAVVGILMLMVSKKQKRKDLGTILIGFAILMTGMSMMSSSMSPLADDPKFQSALVAFSNPVFGVIIGAVITGIIQSSAASIGILQSLSMTGLISYKVAIPIIMGCNIGTCMTAILSSIGVNRKAKRVAAVHISIKIIGTIFWLIVFEVLNAIFHFAILDSMANPVGIAISHTIFNLLTILLLFPFQKQLDRLAHILIKDTEEEQELFLDERLMVTPSIAVAECQNAMDKMVGKARKGLDAAIDLLRDGYSQEKFEFVGKNEKKIDSYEDHIGAYLMKLTTTQHLSEADKRAASTMLHGIGEFERLADHAHYMAKSAEELNDKKIQFSPQAQVELKKLLEAVQEIYMLAVQCYEKQDLGVARRIEPLQDVISVICESLKERHIERLETGVCTAEQGFIFNDVLYSCGRIADHSMNIAAIVLRIATASSGEGYMHDIKKHHSPENEKMYDEYYEKFMPDKAPQQDAAAESAEGKLPAAAAGR